MNKKANRDIMDLLKVVLSIFVVLMHINPFGKYGFIVYPICRIAVPLFFMMSGFFLFQKIMKNEKNRNEVVVNFIKRNLKLYLFWFIILLPITLVRRNYFSKGVLKGFVRIIYKFLFSSTFAASWYIMALTIGAVLVFLITRKISNKKMLILSFIVYLACCAITNYRNLFTGVEWINLNVFNEFKISNNFCVSLIWLCIGKMFAENEIKILKDKRKLNICIIVSIVFLFLEHIVINCYNLSVANDCYIMLIPVCFFIFEFVLQNSINVRHAKEMRKFSTITYCLHYSIGKVLLTCFDIIKLKSYYSAIISFLVVILVCVGVTYIVHKLENKKLLKWLKYSY